MSVDRVRTEYLMTILFEALFVCWLHIAPTEKKMLIKNQMIQAS